MYYVALDADRVQDYVFASVRLRGIRNGSRQLEEADGAAGALLDEGERIRALGGVVLARFEDRSRRDWFLRQAPQLYRSRGIGVETAWIEAPPLPGDFYSEVLQRLLGAIRMKKDSASGSAAGEPGSILAATCDISGRGAASSLVKVGHEWQRARAVETTKWSLPDETDLVRGMVANWPNADEIEFPRSPGGVVGWDRREDAAGIANRTRDSEERLLGMIFADVNGLGKLLPVIARSAESLRDFAPGLRNALRDALADALQAEVMDLFQRRRASSGVDLAVPFRVLYLGGDDLCLLITGPLALPVAGRLATYFETRSSALLAPFRTDGDPEVPDRLTLSAGVVLAPYRSPILALRRLGQGLESRAKSLGRAWAGLSGASSPGLLDFHLWVNETAGSVEQMRRPAHARAPEVLEATLYGGPYVMGGGNAPTETFLPLKKLLSAAEELANLPHSKRNHLRSILADPGAATLYAQWWDHLDPGTDLRSWRKACRLLGVPLVRGTLPFRTSPPLNTPVLDCLQMVALHEVTQRWRTE